MFRSSKGGVRSGIIVIALLLTLSFLISGCGMIVSRHPAPESRSNWGKPMGISNVRAWGDEYSPLFQKRVDTVTAIRDKKLKEMLADGKLERPMDMSYLILSGGGADGAFSAGVLCGWTERGDRPEFQMVSGVSTGALIAPFAFLGSEYDGVIQKMYTTITSKQIFSIRSIFDIIGGDSLADTTPLARTVDSCVDEKVLEAVAREYEKGRNLIIATTNLDAKRSVVWDMGAIASSGHPNALELFRRVMRASASIPVFFPPTYISIEGGQQDFDEMHVDGGAVSQYVSYESFIRPKPIKSLDKGHGKLINRDMYIIVNNRLSPTWKVVPPLLKDIAATSISSLIRSQAMDALFKTYLYTQRDGINFRLMSIPTKNYPERKEEFDPVAMRVLFNMGRKAILSKDPWLDTPPGYRVN